jgi:transporter family-2 protein
VLIFLSFLAGVASSTQGLFNGYWQERTDLKTTMLVNMAVLLALALLLYLPDLKNGIRFPLEKMTPSILVGGVCGFLIVLAFAVAFPVLGATTTSLLYIAGLLIAAVLFDTFGTLGQHTVAFTFERALGLVLVMAGSYLAIK